MSSILNRKNFYFSRRLSIATNPAISLTEKKKKNTLFNSHMHCMITSWMGVRQLLMFPQVPSRKTSTVRELSSLLRRFSCLRKKKTVFLF